MDRCATIGCPSPGTVNIEWSDAGSPVIELVCVFCADSYVNRPALRAATLEVAR